MLRMVIAGCALFGVGIFCTCPMLSSYGTTVIQQSDAPAVQQKQSPSRPAAAVSPRQLSERNAVPLSPTNSVTRSPNSNSTNFPAHEWVFVTESDGLLFGDFIEPIELELKFEYGTANIPLADIVSFSRVQTEDEKKQKTAQPNSFGTSPAISNFPNPGPPGQFNQFNGQGVPETATTPENSGEVASNTEAESDQQENTADNRIVVATKSGNVLVGRCDLPDFHVRTEWGTMTIDNSRVNAICCKSCGLKRLVQSTSAEGWLLMPLQFRNVAVDVQGDARQAAFAPQKRVQLRPANQY